MDQRLSDNILRQTFAWISVKNVSATSRINRPKCTHYANWYSRKTSARRNVTVQRFINSSRYEYTVARESIWTRENFFTNIRIVHINQSFRNLISVIMEHDYRDRSSKIWNRPGRVYIGITRHLLQTYT